MAGTGAIALVASVDDRPPVRFWTEEPPTDQPFARQSVFAAPGAAPIPGWEFSPAWTCLSRSDRQDLLGRAVRLLRPPCRENAFVRARQVGGEGGWCEWVRTTPAKPFADDFPPDASLAGTWRMSGDSFWAAYTALSPRGGPVEFALLSDGRVAADARRPGHVAGRWGARDGVVVVEYEGLDEPPLRGLVGAVSQDGGRIDGVKPREWTLERAR